MHCNHPQCCCTENGYIPKNNFKIYGYGSERSEEETAAGLLPAVLSGQDPARETPSPVSHAQTAEQKATDNLRTGQRTNSKNNITKPERNKLEKRCVLDPPNPSPSAECRIDSRRDGARVLVSVDKDPPCGEQHIPPAQGDMWSYEGSSSPTTVLGGGHRLERVGQPDGHVRRDDNNEGQDNYRQVFDSLQPTAPYTVFAAATANTHHCTTTFTTEPPDNQQKAANSKYSKQPQYQNNFQPTQTTPQTTSPNGLSQTFKKKDRYGAFSKTRQLTKSMPSELDHIFTITNDQESNEVRKGKEEHGKREEANNRNYDMNTKRLRDADDNDNHNTQEDLSNQIQIKRSCPMQANTIIRFQNEDEQSIKSDISNASEFKQSNAKNPVVSLCGGCKPVSDEEHQQGSGYDSGNRQFHDGPSPEDHKEMDLGGRGDPTVHGQPLLPTAPVMGTAGIATPSAVQLGRGTVEGRLEEEADPTVLLQSLSSSEPLPGTSLAEAGFSLSVSFPAIKEKTVYHIAQDFGGGRRGGYSQ